MDTRIAIYPIGNDIQCQGKPPHYPPGDPGQENEPADEPEVEPENETAPSKIHKVS